MTLHDDDRYQVGDLVRLYGDSNHPGYLARVVTVYPTSPAITCRYVSTSSVRQWVTALHTIMPSDSTVCRPTLDEQRARCDEILFLDVQLLADVPQ